MQKTSLAVGGACQGNVQKSEGFPERYPEACRVVGQPTQHCLGGANIP